MSIDPKPLKEDIKLRKAGIGFLSICFFLLMRPGPAAAQESQLQTLKLNAAVELALSNYPSIRASQAQAAAAEAGIDVARVAYLPRMDMLWQQNVATRNNVFGLLFPQSVIPQISGPVSETSSSLQGATGSAGGLLFSWEPFDFGLRRANVGLARAAHKQAGAGVVATRLDVAFAAADAFLGVIAADQVALAAQTNVERMEVFARAVQTLVDNQLRPGVDASHFQSAVFGRGTGARVDGSFDNLNGLYPNTGNWAVGMTIIFPAFDIFGIRARRRVECNNIQAEQARYDQTIQTLKTQDARARALVEGSRRIAENTPIQLKAAQETELRARVRYENGLANVTEVAEAQRLLAQAEADDAVARLAVWRALLVTARMQGDLKPFLEQVAKTPIKGK